MKPLFSIIMPVYGVERYLSEAVDSVLGQTCGDFELILVDDCSPDGCPAICDEYAEKDSRVRVIHKVKNEGLGYARNTGFDAAKGEYILFMDSDDSLTPDCFEVLSRESKGYDITVFGINRFFEDKDGNTYKTENLCPKATVTADKTEVGQLLVGLNKSKVFPFAWNKIYNSAFLKKCNIVFEKTKLIEDFLFNIQVFPQTEKIKVLDSCFYNYRRPAHQTLVNTYSPEFFELVKRKFNMECEFLKNTNSDTEDNLQYIYFIFVKHLFSAFLRNGAKSAALSGKEQIKLIKEYLNDSVTEGVLNKYRPEGIVCKVLKMILKGKMARICYFCTSIIAVLKK